jgi:vancomycin resistance protein VanJ
MASGGRRGRARRATARIALAGIVVIAAAEWLLLLLRPEAGLAGALQVVAPHLALIGLVLVPFSFVAGRRAFLAMPAALLLVVGIGLRFGSEWVSLPRAGSSPDAMQLHVVTWNLEVGSRPGVDTAEMIGRSPADIVAVQELRPNAAAAIDADPAIVARYPYRILVPRDDVGGMGLLSRLPLTRPTFQLDPIIQSARMDLGGGRRLAIVNVHPFHAELERAGSVGLPVGLDPARRNADLQDIRSRIEASIQAGTSVILLGDLNTATSEPAFDRFVQGLRDVHREVGNGPGWTWRPIRLEFLGFGLVGIDHVVVSPDITPTSVVVTCPVAGDHCLVDAGVAIAGSG